MGREILQVLAAWGCSSIQVGLFASERSAGVQMETPWGVQPIQAFDAASVGAYDVAFLAVSGAFSQDVVPDLPCNVVIIDTSSAFRYDPKFLWWCPELTAML